MSWLTMLYDKPCQSSTVSGQSCLNRLLIQTILPLMRCIWYLTGLRSELTGGHNYHCTIGLMNSVVSHYSSSTDWLARWAISLSCCKMSVSQQWHYVSDCNSCISITMWQHHDNMQQQKAFTGRILFSSTKVYLTAYWQSKSAKMVPKPQINFSQGSVATVCKGRRKWTYH